MPNSSRQADGRNNELEQAITYGIEQGWIDRSASKNRLNGLEEVHRKMPKELQTMLPPLIIFSPPLNAGGATFRREIPPSSVFIYLSPTLEKEHCINATWGVAHEFAHVVLGHGHYRLRNQAEVEKDEREASELASKWVPKHNPEQSRFLKLLHMGEEAMRRDLEKLQNPEE
jgi:hypothetical protein